MSDGLFPTKTRLALLQAVDDGDVRQRYPMLPDPDYTELDRGPGAGVSGARYVKVTSRVEELARAGWVRIGARESEHYKAPRRWELTDLGRSILDGGAP